MKIMRSRGVRMQMLLEVGEDIGGLEGDRRIEREKRRAGIKGRIIRREMRMKGLKPEIWLRGSAYDSLLILRHTQAFSDRFFLWLFLELHELIYY
jgi:hypothetical protein